MRATFIAPPGEVINDMEVAPDTDYGEQLMVPLYSPVRLIGEYAVCLHIYNPSFRNHA